VEAGKGVQNTGTGGDKVNAFVPCRKPQQGLLPVPGAP
jgi:hypothetical protein